MPLKPGLTGKSTTMVTHENTAAAVGAGGVEVFSTPMMIALMENAAWAARRTTWMLVRDRGHGGERTPSRCHAHRPAVAPPPNWWRSTDAAWYSTSKPTMSRKRSARASTNASSSTSNASSTHRVIGRFPEMNEIALLFVVMLCYNERQVRAYWLHVSINLGMSGFDRRADCRIAGRGVGTHSR